MLREHDHVRQIPGETHRRWFFSDDFDLIVWQEPGGPLEGFQLCYREGPQQERALTWTLSGGYCHERLDDGEPGGMGFKMSPILLPDGVFEKEKVISRFRVDASSLEPELAREIVRILQGYEQ
jgi:hypothetical protein